MGKKVSVKPYLKNGHWISGAMRFDPRNKKLKPYEDKVLNNPNFQAWFEGSHVTDDLGKPKRVLHGTTHDFKVFKNAKGYTENDWGQGHYFTSAPEDVNYNYARVDGPDLTSRVERLAEQLAQQDNSEEYSLYEDIARGQLVEHEGAVMPVYLSIKIPLVLDKDSGTYFDFEIDDNDKESGLMVNLYKAVLKVAPKYGQGGEDIWRKMNADVPNIAEGMYAFELFNSLKESESLMYIEDNNGNLVINQFLQDVVKAMGFDGIIYNNIKDRFPHMPNIPNGTKHYIVFKSNQVKSATGNSGVFDPKSPDITKGIQSMKFYILEKSKRVSKYIILNRK